MNHSWMLIAALSCTAAMADSNNNNATITHSGNQYDGVVSTNQAAGDQQQLSNNLAIAVGHNAQANLSVTQKNQRRSSRPLPERQRRDPGQFFQQRQRCTECQPVRRGPEPDDQCRANQRECWPAKHRRQRHVATDRCACNRLSVDPYHWQPPGRYQRPGLHRQPWSGTGQPERRGGEPSG